MEENCYIHGKGCEEDSYSISKWRNQFGNDYPKYHYFYDGFEFERDQSKLFDLKTVLKKYLEPYFEGTLSDLTDGLPTIETDMSDFYLQEMVARQRSVRDLYHKCRQNIARTLLL